jgi:hypothetical protein
MTKAAPLPVFRGGLAQPPSHGIAMDISQFLDKLVVVPNIEVVVALLPEMFCPANEPSRNPLLERPNRIGKRALYRLAEQQMHVIRHDDIPEHAQSITAPYALERSFESQPCLMRSQRCPTVIAAERDEVGLSGLMETFQSGRHPVTLTLRRLLLKLSLLERENIGLVNPYESNISPQAIAIARLNVAAPWPTISPSPDKLNTGLKFPSKFNLYL